MSLVWTILAAIALLVICVLPIAFVVVGVIWAGIQNWHHSWYLKKGRFK